MMGWYHDGMGWGGWVLMTTAMVAFWALVVIAVIAIFRDTQRSPRSSVDRVDCDDPLHILDERFARGEIDEEEYHARHSVLSPAKGRAAKRHPADADRRTAS